MAAVAAALDGPPPVVMGAVLGKDGPQVPFAEIRMRVGHTDLGRGQLTVLDVGSAGDVADHPNRRVAPRAAGRIVAGSRFGLIAIEDLHAHGLTAAADLVAEVIVVTVSLSVLLHGLTAGVIAARWPADRAMSDPTRAVAGQPESRKPST